jgi:hypothetical protein
LSGTPSIEPRTATRASTKRYPLLFAFSLLAGLCGGLLASGAVGAWLSFLPALAGLGLGALPGYGLPFFLALRADAALKRRGLHAFLRRVAFAFLLVGTQIAVAGSVLTFTEIGPGHVAATWAGALETAVGENGVSSFLEGYARRAGAWSDDAAPAPPMASPPAL